MDSPTPGPVHDLCSNGDPPDLANLRAEDSAVERVEETRDRLRTVGREAVGVVGDSKVRSLRTTLAGTGVGLYPAGALGALAMVDQLQQTAMTVLAPEITAALGMPRATFATTVIVRTLAVTLAMLPLAALVQRHARRAFVCVVAAYVWTAMTAATAFVVSIWGLLIILALSGAMTATVASLHQPLVLDSYPPAARMRVLSLHQAVNSVGDVAGPLLIGLGSAIFLLTWRGVFLVLAAVSLVAAIGASWLRDPGFGRWDAQRIRDAVRSTETAPGDLEESDARLGFFEIARRLLMIPTVRRVLTAYAVLGMLLAPFATYLAFFLQERWGMGPGARAVFMAGMSMVSIPVLIAFSKRGEAMFRQDPASLLRLAGASMGVGVLSMAVAIFVPFFGAMVLMFGVAFGTIAIQGPALGLPTLAIVPAHMRPHLAALSGITLAGVGGTAGLLLLSGIDRRFGTGGAIVSLAFPGVAAGWILWGAARTVNDDLNRMVDEVVEGEEIRALAGKGVRLPMLACRRVDFSYGQMQVLFDVDFTVDDGEIVALLGTNGAGKSTLLRVISGLGLPQKGSVRYRGVDVTFVDAERRVGLGISQVPGGRAVFQSLTVAENLRAFAHSYGRDRRKVESGIDVAFEAFPMLADRRDQHAGTLSGGEQQMLGLATAFILSPRLLLIDELSLGLAPKVVRDLLAMVRRINAAGTAVVLVEQSVNVALSVVEHAYFMEKGEVRFDGRAADLIDRPDLLRSVFLDGARQGTAIASADGQLRE